MKVRRNSILLTCICLFCCVFGSSAIQAATIVVGPVSSDFATIAEAIDAASAGDIIQVQAGMYYEHDLDFGGKDIVLTSMFGARQTIIDCENKGRAFNFSSGETTAARIKGFTLQNGTAGHGGAISITNASPTLSHLILFNNNATGNGGALYLYGSVSRIDNSLFYENSATSYGGVMEIQHSSQIKVVNCTFVTNQGNYGGAVDLDTSALEVYNSIFWGNSAGSTGDQINIYNASAVLDIRNNDIEGGIAAINNNGVLNDYGGNIDADPLFHGYGNYRLRPGSPCIDAGDAEGLGFSESDYALDGVGGIHRQVGGIIDIGAYEYYSQAVEGPEILWAASDSMDQYADGTTILIPPGTYLIPAGKKIQIQSKAVALVSTGGADEPVVLDGGSRERAIVILSDTSRSNVAIEGFKFVNCKAPTAADSADWEGGGAAVYIDGSVLSLRNCVLRRNSSTNGGAVYIASRESGGESPLFQSLLNITGSRFVRNTAQQAGGAVNVGMISETTDVSANKVFVADTLFYENKCLTGVGGALSFQTNLYGMLMDILVERSRFIRNQAFKGGAVNAKGVKSFTAVNSIFLENTADRQGAAVYLTPATELGSGAGLFAFCTFHKNSAVNEGSTLDSSNDWTQLGVYNSIFWENSSADRGAIQLTSEELTMDSCILQGGIASVVSPSVGSTPVLTASGIIEEDPVLVYHDADLHLMPDSPAVDHGTTTLPVAMPEVDFDGHARVLDGDGDSTVVPDIGAYEHCLPSDTALGVSREFFFFGYNKSKQVIPDAQTLQLKNSSEVNVVWQFVNLPDWISVSPDGVQERYVLQPGDEQNVSLSCIPEVISQMDYGLHSAVLAVYDADTNEQLATVEVELTVTRTIVVPTDYPTIQQAIDAAVDGDDVLVEAGTYTGIGNRDISFLGKRIVVHSSSGPENTIVDVQQTALTSAFLFESGETGSSVLDGFTITNATSSAIRISSAATIVNCIFDTNGFPDRTDWVSRNGGAMTIDGNNSYIANCQFLDNWAGYHGLGVVAFGEGGAMNITGNNNTIYNCLFSGNGIKTSSTYYTNFGGAVMVRGTGNSIRSSRFQGNHAENAGGGVYLFGTVERNFVENCTFDSNVAVSAEAGGLFVGYGTVHNSVFYYNRAEGGTAIAINRGEVDNCTFVQNTGVDYTARSCLRIAGVEAVPIVNNLFYQNSSNQIDFSYSGTAQVSYSVIPYTSSGTANEDYDYYHANSHIDLGSNVYWYNESSQPLPMVNSNGQDYRLNPEFYYCIDQGTVIPDIYSDIRGSIRPVDGDDDGNSEFDIGAYEYSRYFGGSELDSPASPFSDLHIESSVILVGHEYEVQWKDKNPFPNFDDRVYQAGEYDVMLSLVNESGRRINLLEYPRTIRLSPLGYSLPVTFTPEHLGTWRIRLEIADDPGQFIESAPILIEYKDVISVHMGEQIHPPAAALTDQKPVVDIENAVYWSADTKRLWAVKPTTVVVSWYTDVEHTDVVSMVIHIKKPDDPLIHIAHTQPVDLLPEGTPYDMVNMLYTASGASMNANTFSAENEGYSVLFFRDEQAEQIETREIVQVVRTVYWNHTPVDAEDTITFPHIRTGYLGEELIDGDHNALCGSGYVFYEDGWYDGYGENRAYDRSSRTGPIFPVNALQGDTDDGRDNLLVVWYRQETNDNTGVCWPDKPDDYEVEPPVEPPVIVVASGLGSGELRPGDFGAQEDMMIYSQPDRIKIGYNPNEEHAAFFTAQASENPAVFALRNDLNRTVTDLSFTSDPYVLLKYRDPKNNGQWNFRAYKVVDASSRYQFSGTVQEDSGGNARYYIDGSGGLQPVSGNLPQVSYYLDARGHLKNPSDLDDLCYNYSGGTISVQACLPENDVKVHYLDLNGQLQVLADPQPSFEANGLLAPGSLPTDSYFIDPFNVLVKGDVYYRFYYPQTAGGEINPFYPLNQMTFGPCAESETTTPLWVLEDKDHKFFAKNGGLSGGIQDVTVKYYYRLQSGFYYDRNGDDRQDPETPLGSCIPLLDHGSMDPQAVDFAVSWPSPVPTLHVGETLMDAKMQEGESVGLPNIKDQCIATVLYDQPVEQSGNYDSHSVNLIDPLQEHKLIWGLADPEGQLPQALKPKMNLSTGRWEFPGLPEHLRLRLSYDPVDGLDENSGLYGSLKLRGSYKVDTGEPTILLNVLSSRDLDTIKAVLLENPPANNDFITHVIELNDLQALPAMSYPASGAVTTSRMYPQRSQFDSETKALTAGDARGTGYVTLSFNNHPDCAAPTTLQVIRVAGPLYQGEIKVIEPVNPFEEKLTLRHNGDFGGQSDGHWFQWKYLPADFSGIPCPPDETPETYGQDCVVKNWQDYFAVDAVNNPPGSTTDTPPVDQYPDGSPDNFYKGAVDVTVQGTGQQLLPDKWFSVRYYDDKHLLAPSYPTEYEKTVSSWTNPQLYEGWIKRVMKKINLFDQKAKDFHAGDVNTVSSMISLAGEEYEGNVALSDNPEYLQHLGMIQVYETLLDRGNSLAEGIDSADINKALLFAANRLADLYVLLGNEAYGDAEDPTIGFSTEDGQVGLEASSIFCFENQVDSQLDEELALLRGRSEPGIRPYYNRLVWNFTLGDGEVAYKENYNISDQPTLDTDNDTFADTPDGEVNEMDAKIMFPMGHGDAWGHYLSAVKKYYSLFKKDNFTWIPQSEAILVAGNPVQVDYRDERKFAVAAAARAKTGAEIVDLTYRKFYTEDPDGQWQGYKDTDSDRAWGLSGWSKRAGQGAFLDWVAGNSMLPDMPGVLEGQYAVEGQTVFTLSKIVYTPGAESTLSVYHNGTQLIPGPANDYIESGTSEVTLTTAAAAGDELVFEAKMADSSFTVRDIAKIDRTSVLELGEIVSSYNAIQAKMDEADAQLNPLGIAKESVPFDIDPAQVANGETHFEQIYGRAVDAMNNAIAVFNHANQNTSLLRRQQDSLADFQRNIENMEADYNNRLIEVYGYPYPEDCGPGKLYSTPYCSSGPDLYHYMYADASELMGVTSPETFDSIVTLKDYTVNGEGALEEKLIENVPFHMAVDSRFGIIKPESWTGNRKAPGEIQFAHSELLQTRGRFEKAIEEYGNMLNAIELQADLIQTQFDLNRDEIFILNRAKDQQVSLNQDVVTGRSIINTMQTAARLATLVANATAEAFPGVTGIIAGFSNGAIVDVLSGARGAAKAVGSALSELSNMAANAAALSELSNQQAKELVSLESNISLTTVRNDFAVKQQLLQLENMIRNASLQRLELFNLMESLRQSGARYLAVMAKGQRLLADRHRFRRQTAAQIQDYRYKDMTFRIFRNDALQQYRAQFDMAARYVYLAAKAYDYETTLLDSDSRAGSDFLSNIVRQRTIGFIENGQPLTGSGLADPMKRMAQNFQVLKNQLGFNNPQVETNRFSLRQELMRVRMDSGSNSTWQRALRSYLVKDLWDVPEFRRYCRPFAAEGVAQPGLVIPFTTTVTSGLNFFGWPLSGGDSYYSSTNFATKVRSVGVWFSNYNAVGLAQTPRIYLIPVGEDILRTPSSSFKDIRTWQVVDQKLPQPFPVDTTELENNPDWIPSVDTVFDEMFEIRKHSDFRAYHDSGYINQSEMQYDTRLIGRSVWNSRWLLIIPGQSLLYDPDEGLDTFINGPLIEGSDNERTGNGIFDIKLFFETYGYSGN